MGASSGFLCGGRVGGIRLVVDRAKSDRRLRTRSGGGLHANSELQSGFGGRSNPTHVTNQRQVMLQLRAHPATVHVLFDWRRKAVPLHVLVWK